MKRHLILIFSLSLVLGVNIYFRIFTINFPQLKTQARNTIEQKIYREANQEIDKKLPEFSLPAKDILIKTFILEYKRKNKPLIKEQVQKEYLKLKDNYQDKSGQTYLLELDCWHWANYVENVYRTGHPGYKVINDKCYDSLLLAPSGNYLCWNNFLFYLSSFLYKIFSLVKPVPLLTFLFYLPIFFISVFIAALYLFCSSRFGAAAAVISCLFVGLAPIFLSHSSAGWFDMDILNLLFPLLVVWAYLKAYEAAHLSSRCLWIFISCLWVGLFCYTWPGWWFIFLLIIIYEIYSFLYLIFRALRYKEKNLGHFKKHLLSLPLFLGFGLFWVILFSGFLPLIDLYLQVKQALTLNKPLIDSIWPNVYYTVGELRKADFFAISSFAGGTVLFITSLSCMLLLFSRTLRKREYADFQAQAITILMLWFIVMFFACFRGVRFVMFLLMPLGISLGWIINEAYSYFKNAQRKPLALAVMAIFIAFSAVAINNADKQARSIYPLMNDNWHKVLTVLKESTPREAILNSWWDFGDWFKTVSKRKVIFDGQSQNSPRAYWMARILLADNEEEVIRILRMLNNGGNQAFEILNKHINDPLKSFLLLEKAIFYQPKAAQEALLKFLPSSAVEETIKLLFDKPPKAYFIVDPTMQDKVRAISYLGNWDFLKAYLLTNINKKGKDEIGEYLIKLGIAHQLAQRLYQEASLISQKDLNGWLSQEVSFHSGLSKAKEQKDILLFDNGLVYNPKEKTAYVYSADKYSIPKSLLIFENDTLQEIVYPNNELAFSVLVFKAEGDYRSILLEPKLAKSLLVRLYFLNGAGLKYFKPFIEEKDGDEHIRVFEINWE